MNHQKLTVCKSNRVIEAGYRLTLNEQRTVLACIAQVDSVEKLFETKEFEISAIDFAKLYSISNENAYQALIDVAKSLYQRSLTIYDPYPDRPKLKKIETRWISAIGYIPEESKIVLSFAPHLLPFLGGLQKAFTKYKLEYVSKMTCIYAIRLYELLVQWQGTGTGKREIEIDWLKKQFQIEDAYERMFDLKKYVIDPAIKDINEHSNFKVSWTQRKTGRRVTHLTFIFEDKAAAKTEKPKTKHKKKFSPAEWQEYVRVNARVGESWAQATARIKDELNKKTAT